MAANMGQMWTGMGYGARGVPGSMPVTPGVSLQAGATGSVSSGSGVPLGILLLAAIGGLVVLYYGTRTIQGVR
jgi:hypothetical protein